MHTQKYLLQESDMLFKSNVMLCFEEKYIQLADHLMAVYTVVK